MNMRQLIGTMVLCFSYATSALATGDGCFQEIQAAALALGNTHCKVGKVAYYRSKTLSLNGTITLVCQAATSQSSFPLLPKSYFFISSPSPYCQVSLFETEPNISKIFDASSSQTGENIIRCCLHNWCNQSGPVFCSDLPESECNVRPRICH